MTLDNLAIEDYMRDGKGVFFERIYVGHIKLCSDKAQVSLNSQPCFCNKYAAIDVSQLSTS